MSTIPYGYCQCGCGRPAPISKQTDTKRGYVKGQPHRFCRSHRLPKVTTNEGFWRRVQVGDPDECWPWLGYINDSGYGVTRTAHNKQIRASHIAYHLAYGPIPNGLKVLHSCDNPPCCNPKHLFAGTDLDNVRDMHQKGRESHATGKKGEAHGMAKLNTQQILEIRQLAADGISYAEIGRRFSITDVHAGRIAMRRVWSHVP